MKAIKIAELKNGLSRFLKRVERGESFLVTDRSRPVAELTPLREAGAGKHEQLVAEGKILPSSRTIRSVHISPMKEKVDIQSILQQVRDE